MPMDIYEDFMCALLKAIEEAGNLNQLATKSGLPASTLKRWRDRERVPNLQSIAPLLPYLDWSFSKHEGDTDEDKAVTSKDLMDALKRCEDLKMEVDQLKAQLLEHKDRIIELLSERKEIASSCSEEATDPPQERTGERKLG